MTSDSFSAKKILWIIPPIIAGIIFLMMMKSGKQSPQLVEYGEAAQSVRTLQIISRNFIPVVQGYGSVQPAHVWKAVAQVSGRIISMHSRLQDGEVIQKGEELFQIDPVDYELNLAQAETQLLELDVQLKNTSSSLQIEQRNLALATREHQRLLQLVTQGSVSQSSADAAERTMLSSTAQVQNLKNSLSLIPSQKKLQQARVTQAQRDLANTLIRAPFNLRVSALTIEADQYVSKGQQLFSGDSVDRIEIIAQVALSSLKNLFIGHPAAPTDIQSLATNLNSFTGFKPTVRLDMGNTQQASWEAEFVRFSDSVDSQTRTMGVVVAVDKPLQKIVPGIRPPLSKGMFVEVSIAGHAQPDSIVIPRAAIRNGMAYVMDKDQRLDIRPIKKLYDQQDMSIIGQGLSAGEQLVLSDLIPAVQGMLLKPVAAVSSSSSPATGG
ncbi:MAG: efflux RND transporter periplasmic adaptor subunit [Gammaproteobacteria bacterium]|nr:efflux RND transporter periplasmic adaptor subunit [Gammaproteobacteria bacterium]MBL6999011.1 efflux RND transporter periplasmic adaptor subunit [Gammaproteobacteria bacterium]